MPLRLSTTHRRLCIAAAWSVPRVSRPPGRGRIPTCSAPTTLPRRNAGRTVACGTELNVIQEGIPAVIPVEMCYLGWQESLAELATLVEPDLPG